MNCKQRIAPVGRIQAGFSFFPIQIGGGPIWADHPPALKGTGSGAEAALAIGSGSPVCPRLWTDPERAVPALSSSAFINPRSVFEPAASGDSPSTSPPLASSAERREGAHLHRGVGLPLLWGQCFSPAEGKSSPSEWGAA